jgi:hypothetical protein
MHAKLDCETVSVTIDGAVDQVSYQRAAENHAFLLVFNTYLPSSTNRLDVFGVLRLICNDRYANVAARSCPIEQLCLDCLVMNRFRNPDLVKLVC